MNMKKWFRFVLIFILLVTGAIQAYKWVTLTGDKLQVINQTKEVSLNEFLKQYNANTFSKIALEDETNLKWYQYVGTGKTFPLMSLNKSVTEEQYNLLTTVKPIGTSLKDLGIS